MNWQDTGILLTTRPFGENKLIADIFCQEHGKVAGLIRRGKQCPQPGTLLTTRWSGRQEDSLGWHQLELSHNPAAGCLYRPTVLLALSSLCSLLQLSLAERQEHPALFTATEETLRALTAEDALGAYCRWEITLLQELGFGLNLHQCTLTGATDNLAFVSPKTGRAVQDTNKIDDYRQQLLPLPSFLVDGETTADDTHVQQALRLTGHFLQRWLLDDQPLPLPRTQLSAMLSSLQS